MRQFRTAILVLGAICGNAAGAAAQQSPDAAAGMVTLQDESAAVVPGKLVDRYNVNAVRFGYASGAQDVPRLLQGIGQAVWGDGVWHYSIDIGQQIFTPADTLARQPPAGDRPYAGLLLGSVAVARDVPDSHSLLAASLGVVGPWALAEQTQAGFHDLFGQTHPNGWGSQLHNEPALELTSARIWRLPLGAAGGIESDILPSLAAGVGNVRIYGMPGVQVRLGQGLNSDYGVPRIVPGLSAGDAFTPSRPVAWYVFAGADGQAVAHDITLNGNDFQDSARAKIRPLLGEMQAGLAVMAEGARLTYTQIMQTQEFEHQKGGLHQTGSLALSVHF